MHPTDSWRLQDQALMRIYRFLPLRDKPAFQGSDSQTVNAICRWMKSSLEVRDSIELSLAGLKVKVFPAAMKAFIHLKTLNLHQTELLSVPSIIHRFSELESLDLSDNALTLCSDSICQLKALRALNLAGNRIRSLSDTIGDLQSLTSLDLSKNKFPVIPVEIKKIKHLKSLNFSSNRLSGMLPFWVAESLELKSLDLSRNQLDQLCPKIGDLRNLAYLNISHNHLQNFPDSFYHLRCIVILNDNPFSLDCRLPLRRFAAVPVPFYLHCLLKYWAFRFEQHFPEDQYPNDWASRTKAFHFIDVCSSEERENLKLYLDKLERVYLGDVEQKHISFCVEKMVQLAAKSVKFKEALFNHMSEGVQACGDRALLILSDIEVLCRFHDTIDESAFRSLSIRASRYELLKQYARRIVEERDLPEQTEIVLCYLIRLRSSLDLPISAKQMLYDIQPVITSDMLKGAEKRMKRYKDRELLALSDPWKNWMEEHYPEQAMQIKNKYGLILEIVENYCGSTYKTDWLEAYQSDLGPELLAIIRTLGELPDYHWAAKVVQKKRSQALANLDNLEYRRMDFGVQRLEQLVSQITEAPLRKRRRVE